MENNNFKGQDKFREAGKLILEGLEEMGLELDDSNFIDTPERFGRAYCEIFEGCSDYSKKVEEILSKRFESFSNNMVVIKDIEIFSMCPHHLLPVEYRVCVGYIPDGNKVLGISKLVRLVELMGKRPMLQEDLAELISETLYKEGMKGSGCYIEGKHMCMRMRGVRSEQSVVTVTSLKGNFLTSAKVREEWNEAIKSKKSF